MKLEIEELAVEAVFAGAVKMELLERVAMIAYIHKTVGGSFVQDRMPVIEQPNLLAAIIKL